MATSVATVYYKLIKRGQIYSETGLPYTIEDVPETWREEVREMLEDE